ncbi:MAG TPA: peptidase S14 [Advenella kashmirensis]|uniref:ATP-dependent Clp protease proteolytic subunit n=1 Tax=Advenella kashmirensis TaxID=310575 RepID=A0A356LAA6_9BURK|nr:peptidase S14 [Advenella kashmirensis]
MNVKLPKAPTARIDSLSSEISAKALNLWAPFSLEKSEFDIQIFDIIGEDFWGDGVTAKSISRQLLNADGRDVTVMINSPGGSMFEGIAIYNLFREYSGKVTVKVMGIAASAASIIAMAGNEIQMSESSFLMIHNAWVVAAGNRNDLVSIAAQLEPFDKAMTSVYVSRTGQSAEDIAEMMDNETYINGQEAVDTGFADSLFDEPTDKKAKDKVAAHQVDMIMAKQGVPRSERRKLIQELKGTHNAAQDTQNAVQSELLTEIQSLLTRYQ